MANEYEKHYFDKITNRIRGNIQGEEEFIIQIKRMPNLQRSGIPNRIKTNFASYTRLLILWCS